MKGLAKKQEIEFELLVLSDAIHFNEIYELGIRVHKIVRKTKKDFSVFKKVYDICRKYQPDMVHCWDSMSAVYLVPVLKVLKIKLINCMVQDAPAKTGFSNKNWVRGRLTFPFSDIIIGNCEAGLSAYNVPRKKSLCIPNGFDFRRVENLNGHSNLRKSLAIQTKFVVAMVATFSSFKDYATFFAAAQLVLDSRKDVTFLALGKNTDSNEAKSFIQPHYQDCFRLLGTRTDVEAIINIIDVGVLATFTEGISNSIMEYMALGKPVVATVGGGTSEILLDTITGYLAKPRDAQDMADKINTLLNNDQLRFTMGAAGKARVYEDFTIEKMVEGFMNSYKMIA